MPLPTYQQWVEFAAGPGMPAPAQPNAFAQGQPPAQTGVSPPQHTQDEESMDINSLIEKRLRMLLDELEKKKKRPRAELLQILQAVTQQLMSMGLTKGMANTAVRQMGSAPPGIQQPGGTNVAPAQPQIPG